MPNESGRKLKVCTANRWPPGGNGREMTTRKRCTHWTGWAGRLKAKASGQKRKVFTAKRWRRDANGQEMTTRKPCGNVTDCTVSLSHSENIPRPPSSWLKF